MRAHYLVWAGMVTAACVSASAAQAQGQTYRCPATYHSQSSDPNISPGTIDTQRDTPCLVSRFVHGIPWQRVPRPVGPIRVVERPKHGRVIIEDRTSFIYKPAPGYTGTDDMVIRFLHRRQKGGFVRFAITVS